MGFLNILGLRGFIASAKQDNYEIPLFYKINPVSASIVYPEFRYAITHWLNIPKIS
jgi:hypothetical protein